MRASILTPFRSLNHSGIRLRDAIAGILYLLTLTYLSTLTGCATTDEQRFPLDYVSSQEAAYRVETDREALPAYLRMGADLERQGRLADAARAYSNAVTSALALGRLQDALDTSQKAVEMAERSGEPLHLGVALACLGSTYTYLGALEKAIPLFERGALAARRAGNPNVEAINYRGLSSVYRRLGNPAKALEYSKKSVEILANEVQIKTIDWARFGSQGRRFLAVLEWQRYGQNLIALGWDHFALSQ